VNWPVNGLLRWCNIMKTTIIWAPGGCWLQRTSGDVVRSSYLGLIGTTSAVHAYCLDHDIEFVEWRPAARKQERLLDLLDQPSRS